MTSDEELNGPSLDDNDSVAEEPLDGPPQQMLSAEVVTAPEDNPSTLWNRRTFFKSAALGTAAAAMYEGGRAVFSPLTAYAEPLGDLNCTANDVRIFGPGQIVNEDVHLYRHVRRAGPFRLINNTGTDRYCVTVHLCPGIDEDGNVVVPAQDITVGTVPANFNDFITVTIEDWPCGAGKVCFGPCGPGSIQFWAHRTARSPRAPSARGRLLHASSHGTCARTRTARRSTTGSSPRSAGVSRCASRVAARRRSRAANNDCSVPCGGSLGLTVCTSEPASEGPFIFELRSGTTLVERFPVTGTTTDTCHTFTVSPTSATTYFGRVISTQDDPDCVKDSAPVNVTVEDITPTITVSGNVGCTTGELTLTASPAGCDSYAWSIDGEAAGTGNPFTYQPNADTCATRSAWM